MDITPPADGASNVGSPRPDRPRRSYLLTRLVLVVLAVVVPLVALEVVGFVRDRRVAEEAVFRSVSARAGYAGASVETVLARAEQLLTFLATREELQTLNVAACNALLKGVADIGTPYANVLLVNASGTLVCSSLAAPPAVRFSDSAWFRKGLAADGFRLSDPIVGRISDEQISVLSLPVTLRPGEVVGVLGLSLGLRQLAASLPRQGLPPQATLAVVKSNAYFLTRSPDPEAWIGRPVPAQLQRQRNDAPNGVIVGTSADGIERAFASVPLPKYDLRVVAGMPSALLFSQANQEIVQRALTTVLVTFLGLFAAYLAFRKLAAPLSSIAETTRQLAAGTLGIRADEGLPGEFGEVAVEFNRLMERQAVDAAQLRQSEQRALRISNFYEALSSTNQAIVRLRQPRALFADVCDICVKTKLAEMAWIGVVEGTRLLPVAWGGRAIDYTQGLVIEVGDAKAGAEGPTAKSVRLGRPVTVNDFLHEPGTSPWRERAARFNVKSSASFPFMSDGVVAGTLNLYVGEADYFDIELVTLLENMTRDLSFALDAHKRQAARATAERALTERELQLSGIVESVADAIVTVDARQDVIVFNKAAGELFGVSPALALGRPISRYIARGLVSDEAAGSVGGSARRLPTYLTGTREDGTPCLLKAMISTQHGSTGVLTTAVLSDETKLRQAEKARAAILEAEAANRAKSTFLSTVSHELRTPLNAILGFTQLLQMHSRDSLSEQARQQLDNVFLSGTQLRALIDDVMDLSRIEAGQMALDLQDIDLQRLLSDILRMSEPMAATSEVALVPEYDRTPVQRIHTDPIRLRQVLLNLVSNAIKYNKPGGQVTLSFARQADHVVLRVSDNGMGMSRAQLTGLFQPFNRLGRESSSIEGTGIGLSLTRQLVELLGGALDIRSEEDAGTQVLVLLPCSGATPAACEFGAIGATGDLNSAPKPHTPQGVVLYIEDNPVNALLVEQLLGNWPDVQVIVAPTGAQGIERATQLQPDLILLDMNLPDMTGLDVLAQLRANHVTRNLRVVALSASAMPEDVQAARQAGVEDYWTKPIDFVQVLQGLEEKLRHEYINTQVSK